MYTKRMCIFSSHLSGKASYLLFLKEAYFRIYILYRYLLNNFVQILYKRLLYDWGRAIHFSTQSQYIILRQQKHLEPYLPAECVGRTPSSGSKEHLKKVRQQEVLIIFEVNTEEKCHGACSRFREYYQNPPNLCTLLL